MRMDIVLYAVNDAEQTRGRCAGEAPGLQSRRKVRTPEKVLLPSRFIEELDSVMRESNLWDDHALSVLMRLRAMKDAEKHELSIKTRRLGASITELDRAIREIDPNFNPKTIRPRRPQPPRPQPRSGLFSYVEVVYDALKGANGEPVSAGAMAEKALRDKGLDPHADPRLWKKVLAGFLTQLGALRRRNQIERLGEYKGVTWRLRNEVAQD